MLRGILRAVCEGLVRLYYPTLSVEGLQHLPQDRPYLLVVNHPNALLDPLVLRLGIGRSVRFLGKSTLFAHPLSRFAMEAFGAIPVYRPRDGADAAKNEETFRLCREAIARGEVMALFPEGTSHSAPGLLPLKTGAARIALGASLDLQVVPVGLLYEEKTVFRSRVHVVLGAPIAVADFRVRYERDNVLGVQELTEAIREALGRVVLQAETRELYDGVARLSGVSTPEARDDLAVVQARAHELLVAYRALRETAPDELQRIEHEARRYMRILKALGIDDPWALEAERIGFWRAARAVWRVVWRAPWALVGALMGYLPYRLAGRVAGKLAREEDELGTVKLLAGALFLFGAWLVEGTVVGLAYGAPHGVAIAVLGPTSGYIALRFAERWEQLRDGARYLWIRTRKQDLVRALGERRQSLARALATGLEQARLR